MNEEIKTVLLDALAEKYGDINDDCGAYVRTDYGNEWLSVKAIKDLIVKTVNEYDFD